MSGSRRSRGLTLGEVLIALAVLVLFVAIVVPVYRRAQSKSFQDVDVKQMRQVYVAWSLYQSDNNGWPAPSLLAVRGRLGDDSLLFSQEDPFRDPDGGYPVEPMLPSYPPRSPIRISYAYLPNFVEAGQTKLASWAQTLTDPKAGLLACGWHGDVRPTGKPFEALIDGPVLRVNTDGSAFTLPHRRHPDRMGDAGDLFFNR